MNKNDSLQMDVEFKSPQQENGTSKKDEDSPSKEKVPPESETNGTSKESPKHGSRAKRGHRRSRSRTPQQKSDESKTLQISLKKISSELNGKDLTEEPEKTDEKNDSDKIANSEKDEKEISTKGAVKENDDTVKNEKHTKKHKEENKNDDKKDDIQEKEDSVKTDVSPKKATPKKEKKDRTKKQESSVIKNDMDSETVEMDPLIISDEPDPELVFDENSDMESGKGSPIISRCMTRRSQTRNIPTPKTPKSVDQDVDPEKIPTETTENDNDNQKSNQLNNTQESLDMVNLSTMVVIGSDTTRMDYIETHDSNVTEDGSYLNATRERSLGETLRSLSARRPIRPLDDYRRRALRINQERSELNVPYSSSDNIAVTGMKRKNRSATPEDRKKFKGDSPPGLNSLFTSPLTNLRNKFRSDLPSSTPKLMGYRDGRSELHYNDEQNMVHTGDDEKKSWCSIM